MEASDDDDSARQPGNAGTLFTANGGSLAGLGSPKVSLELVGITGAITNLFRRRHDMELSTRNDANPAALIRQEYSSLMTLSNADALREAVTEIVKRSSISEKNFKKFEGIVGRCDLDGLRMYLTNFILAADGDRVLGTRFGEHVANRREFAGQ